MKRQFEIKIGQKIAEPVLCCLRPEPGNAVVARRLQINLNSMLFGEADQCVAVGGAELLEMPNHQRNNFRGLGFGLCFSYRDLDLRNFHPAVQRRKQRS